MSMRAYVGFALWILLADRCIAAEVDSGLGSIYSFARVTSDYRVNGVSSSDRQPATQASVYWAAPRRFFLGAWVSTVDFNDRGKTSLEVDLYAGKTFKLKQVDVTPEVFLYRTDQRGPGLTYDYNEGRVRVQDKLGATTLRSTVGWSPEYSYGAGEVWRFEASAAYAAKSWLTLNAAFGRRWLENRVDRSHWEAGFALRWRQMSLDIRYVHTNLTPRQCGYVDWCEPALIGTLTVDLPRLAKHVPQMPR